MKTSATLPLPSPHLAKVIPAPWATVGDSAFAAQIREQARELSLHGNSILFAGPAGAGRETLARSIHAASPRAAEPFVVLDGQTLPSGAFFDSQLLGHLPGAFAGLRHSSLGIVRSADRGTLFIRDIDLLEPAAQKTLLQVLRTGLVTPLGGIEGLPVDLRVMASTSTDLVELVARQAFDQELLTLISGHVMQVRALAERGDDLPAMVAEALRQMEQTSPEHSSAESSSVELATAAASSHQPDLRKRFSEHALLWMREYAWPGNLHELRSAVQLAASLVEAGSSEITLEHLRHAMKKLHAMAGAFEQLIRQPRFMNSSAVRASLGRRRS